MAEAAVHSNNNFSAPLKHFNIMRARVEPVADLIAAPVETGTQSFDNQVLRPDKLVVIGYINCADPDAQEDIEKINSMYKDRSFNLYSVETKEGKYDNLKLQACPHDNDNKTPDFLVYELTFLQILLVQAQGTTPSNAENTDTRNNGLAMAQ